VIAISDPQSAYLVIQNAFNLAEKYQIPVIVLTEKQIAESLFQVTDLPESPKIERYLVSGGKLPEISVNDRYKLTKTGISPRWLPGQADAPFAANSDEHTSDGSVTEDGEIAREMYVKRLLKLETLSGEIPEPKLIGPADAVLTLVLWGSVKNTVSDVMGLWNKEHPQKSINFLHYEYVYPVRTGRLKDLIAQNRKMVLLENNAFGQLGALLTIETGYQFEDKLLKFDGRPFFIEELIDYLLEKLES
jgi:2-oxoglutarate ferredoxin oxidoreductase subunit alpha